HRTPLWLPPPTQPQQRSHGGNHAIKCREQEPINRQVPRKPRRIPRGSFFAQRIKHPADRCLSAPDRALERRVQLTRARLTRSFRQERAKYRLQSRRTGAPVRARHSRRVGGGHSSFHAGASTRAGTKLWTAILKPMPGRSAHAAPSARKRSIRLLRYGWKRHSENGGRSGRRLDLDRSAVLFDDLLRHGQPKPRALGAFCGEKWFKNG